MRMARAAAAGRKAPCRAAASVAPRPWETPAVQSFEQPCPTSSSSACATRAPSGAITSSPSSRCISMVGIALGVAALIVVLSVMNGFQKELRARILGVASHVQISGRRQRPGRLAAGWPKVAERHPQVVAAAPYVMAQAHAVVRRHGAGALVRGIVPKLEDGVADIGQHMKQGSARRLCSRANSASCWARSWRARSARASATRSR